MGNKINERSYILNKVINLIYSESALMINFIPQKLHGIFVPSSPPYKKI